MPFAGISQHHLKYLIEDNKIFVCVFEHYTEGGYFSRGDEEYLDSRLKFSILKLISEEHKINGLYEFILEYPDIDSHIYWRQNKRPQDASDSEIGEIEVIYNDFKDNRKTFLGLRKSTDSSWTYLDGHYDCWHYAIGQYKQWEAGIIAGPLSEQYNAIKAVRLWMRLPLPKLIPCQNTNIGKCLIAITFLLHEQA